MGAPSSLPSPPARRLPSLRWLLVTAIAVAAALAGGRPAGATNVPPSTVALVSQSPAWVRTASGLLLDVAVKSGLPRSELGIGVALYSNAAARSAFQQTLSGDLQGFTVLDAPSPVPLSTPGLMSGPNGAAELHLPVSAPGLSGRVRTPKDGAVLTVPCNGGGCAGVYPLQISLVNLYQGTALDSFTTYLVLTPPSGVANTDKLQFSWVMPLGSQPAIAPSGTTSASAPSLSEVSLLVSELAQHPGTGLTIGLFGQFAEALGIHKPGDAMHQALGQLRMLMSTPGAEVVPETYTPVDIGAMEAHGFAPEVSDQLARSRLAMRTYLGSEGHADEYISATAIGTGPLQTLTSHGVSRVIVPAPDVAHPPSSVNYTPMMPFVVPGSGAEAIASYPGLDAHLSGPGDIALRANQLLADLAVIYFQGPNEQKGVAMSAPVGWSPDPRFLDTVMSALAASPIVHAATLSALFDKVAPGVDDHTLTSRALAPAPIVPSDVLPTAAVATTRAQLTALGSMSPGFNSMPGLDDRLLLGETLGMSGSERSAYFGTVSSAFHHEASLVTLPFGHVITVTSLQAKVPLTILSRATVPLRARITVSSPDLGFPNARSFPVVLKPGGNSATIELTARTSGDFPLVIELSSPSGTEIATGRLTIRSTAISGVAVGLSIGAIAFLLVWWTRSILQRRRKKHQLRGAELAARVAPPTPSS